eukprot:403353031
MDPEELNAIQSAISRKKVQHKNHDSQMHAPINFTYIPMSKNNMIAFAGNSMPPLQREIQSQMGIDDSDFNLLICVRNLPSLFVPFILARVIDKYGLKNALITLSLCCLVGQMFITLGLTYMNFYLCFIGRIFFGMSDSVTVFQHTILCFWFDSNRLPFVFAILLFLVKVVRALNDNLASVYFNQTQNLASYFWVGTFMCIVSLISSYFVGTLHKEIIENNLMKSKDEVEEQPLQKKDKESQDVPMISSPSQQTKLKTQELPFEYYLLSLVYAFGFACVHSFYHNLSNILQSRFGFNNEDAGHVSSLPYIIAAISTPIFGMLLSRLGEAYYSKTILIATTIILIVHSSIMMLQDSEMGGSPQYLSIIPVALFGLGHALFVTVHGPNINRIVEKHLLAKAFSYMKISENIGSMLMTYTTGIIRVRTDSFVAVNAMFTFVAVLLNIVAVYYYRSISEGQELEIKNSKDVKSDVKYTQVRKQVKDDPNQIDDSTYIQEEEDEEDDEFEDMRDTNSSKQKHKNSSHIN